MLAKSAQPLCMYHECNLDMYEEYVIDHIDHDIAQVFMTVMLTANLQYMRLSLHPVYSIKNQYKSKRKFFPEPRFALFQRPQRSKTFLLSCGDEDDGDRIIRRAPFALLAFPAATLVLHYSTARRVGTKGALSLSLPSSCLQLQTDFSAVIWLLNHATWPSNQWPRPLGSGKQTDSTLNWVLSSDMLIGSLKHEDSVSKFPKPSAM